QCAARRDHPRRGAAEQDFHPASLRTGRLVGCRRMQVVPGRSKRFEQTAAGMRDPRLRGHGSHDQLAASRRMIIELLFTERNHICSVCVSNGHCDLQWMAQKLGLTHVHFPYRYPKANVDASHERFVIDHNRCILCTRCVRVCDEIEGAHVWDVTGRGIDAKVVTDLNEAWGNSETCTSCGKCVHVCPTGALSEKGHAVAEMEKRR